MEHRIEYCGNLRNYRDLWATSRIGTFRNLRNKERRQHTQNQEHHQGIHNPHEVYADRMENEPVWLANKGESVGVATEQQQHPQNDMGYPYRKGYQDKILEMGEKFHLPFTVLG